MSSSESSDEEKPRILVLHGFGQTSEIIQKRGRNLFKRLARDYDLYFPEAKYDVVLSKIAECGAVKQQQGKAWFYYDPENPSNFADYLNREEARWYGVEDSIYFDVNSPTPKGRYDMHTNNLLNYILINGPFYAVIGFSQGAHLLPLLYQTIIECNALAENKCLKCKYNQQYAEIVQFQKMIFMSGFKTPTPLKIKDKTLELDMGLGVHPEMNIQYPNSIDIPTLHIYGHEDEFISNAKSQALVEICHDPKVHLHAKGHVLAQDSVTKTKILQFLQQ